MKWITRTSKNPKHDGVVFIMDGPTFVAKTYNHGGADGEATAAVIIERVNGWEALKARAETAEHALTGARVEIGWTKSPDGPTRYPDEHTQGYR